MQRRYSHRRELILNCVRNSKEHPTAEMVYQQLSSECTSLSRGTVYRNLKILASEGTLSLIPFQVERYDGRTDPHPHLLCSNCGGVSDLELTYGGQALDEEAERQCGVRVDRHELIFYGICANCQLAKAQ